MAGSHADMFAAAATMQFTAPTQQIMQNTTPLDPANDVIFAIAYEGDNSFLIDDPKQPANHQNHNNSFTTAHVQCPPHIPFFAFANYI